MQRLDYLQLSITDKSITASTSTFEKCIETPTRPPDQPSASVAFFIFHSLGSYKKKHAQRTYTRNFVVSYRFLCVDGHPPLQSDP